MLCRTPNREHKNTHFLMKILTRAGLLATILLAAVATPLQAHVGDHPSIHDTVAGVIDRMKKQMSTNELSQLTPLKAEQFLTPGERQILATEHISFRVDKPVKVSVVRDTRLGDEPFWLRQQGFTQTSLTVTEGKLVYDVWQKNFDSGWVGLGVHSLSGGGNHYFVLLAPQTPGEKIKVSDLYPGQLRTATFTSGVEPYVDELATLKAVPEELKGQTLIRTDTDREEDAAMVNVFRWTQYVSNEKPDQVVLTWSEDPRTTQTIQWRTSKEIKHGYVRYKKKTEGNLNGKFRTATAKTTRLETSKLLNDPIVHRHSCVLHGLSPGTSYLYSVGDGRADGWTAEAEFTTAPARTQPFSFIYMGDAQNGLDRWGTLVHNAYRSRPDAAFYLMAGDLVNRGAERHDWDSFFHNAEGVFDHRPLAPAIGNHECQGSQPRLYLEQFTLARNGPSTVPKERAYSFEYGNALFVILDSNLDPAKQAPWLEQQLSKTKAVWKFAVFHHPLYSSGGNRDNPEVRNCWGPIFDKYHLDMALQGHDHAYLRTYPMKGNQRVSSTKDGTVYILSVSGTKSYRQDPHDYTEFGMSNTATFQVLDIQINGNRLTYRAHDIDGKERDELVIEK